jgi:hypothetical protein
MWLTGRGFGFTECSLCDLSVPCFRIANRVNPYLEKDRFYQKAAKIWFQYLQLW